MLDHLISIAVIYHVCASLCFIELPPGFQFCPAACSVREKHVSIIPRSRWVFKEHACLPVQGDRLLVPVDAGDENCSVVDDHPLVMNRGERGPCGGDEFHVHTVLFEVLFGVVQLLDGVGELRVVIQDDSHVDSL